MRTLLSLRCATFGGKLPADHSKLVYGRERLGRKKPVKMWIQVRSMDGRKNVRIDNLSKLTKIEDLREKLVDHFNAEPERQRLFFRGKQASMMHNFTLCLSINLNLYCLQLVDGHSLFDYDVGLNEIVQILVKPAATNTASPSKKENGVIVQVSDDVGSCINVLPCVHFN